MSDTIQKTTTRIFNSTNPNWHKNQDYNWAYLKAQAVYMNDRLEDQGYLFLNDVYRALGFGETQNGSRLGWLSNNPNQSESISFVLNKVDTVDGEQWQIELTVLGDILQLLPEN